MKRKQVGTAFGNAPVCGTHDWGPNSVFICMGPLHGAILQWVRLIFCLSHFPEVYLRLVLQTAASHCLHLITSGCISDCVSGMQYEWGLGSQLPEQCTRALALHHSHYCTAMHGWCCAMTLMLPLAEAAQDCSERKRVRCKVDDQTGFSAHEIAASAKCGFNLDSR